MSGPEKMELHEALNWIERACEYIIDSDMKDAAEGKTETALMVVQQRIAELELKAKADELAIESMFNTGKIRDQQLAAARETVEKLPLPTHGNKAYEKELRADLLKWQRETLALLKGE